MNASSAGGKKKFCSQCGARQAPGNRFCSECGHSLGVGGKRQGGGEGTRRQSGGGTAGRPDRTAASYLPWVLSGLALVAFAVAITLFIQGQAAPRIGDMGMTGGVIDGGADAPVGSGGQAGMMSADALANMPPREAADRLFNRAMTMKETGEDPEQAKFFANMAVQAYAMVPADELDFDARFHLGLLFLAQDDPASAMAVADTVLAADPDHLLALALVARAAEAQGDADRQAEAYRRFLDALPEGLGSNRPEYIEHDRYLEIEAERAREVTGG